MSNYKGPDGPPPSYPQQAQQAHYDAGPANGGYYNQPQDPRAQNEYYGSPAPYQQGPYGGPPQGYPQGQYQQGQYQQGPYQQGPYQQGPYQQQPMMYQHQPMYGPPQGGYFGVGRGRSSGAGEGLCAGLLAALTCCCCLDFLI